MKTATAVKKRGGNIVIDTRGEHVVPLVRAADILVAMGIPEPHHETIRRWACRGVRGVVLESFCVGARRYTSHEAVARFVNATTDGRVAQAGG